MQTLPSWDTFHKSVTPVLASNYPIDDQSAAHYTGKNLWVEGFFHPVIKPGTALPDEVHQIAGDVERIVTAAFSGDSFACVGIQTPNEPMPKHDAHRYSGLVYVLEGDKQIADAYMSIAHPDQRAGQFTGKGNTLFAFSLSLPFDARYEPQSKRVITEMWPLIRGFVHHDRHEGVRPSDYDCNSIVLLTDGTAEIQGYSALKALGLKLKEKEFNSAIRSID